MKLSFNTVVKEAFWGIVARMVSAMIPVRKKHWVFSSDYGQQYREGSKYLLEYMLREHPEYCCTFITRNPAVKKELDQRGIPCQVNFSWRGVLTIAKADSIFSTQYCDDIFFAYPKSGRRYYFLVHGMPYKRAYNAVPEAFRAKYKRNVSFLREWAARVREWLVIAYTLDNVSFISCCSEFLQGYMKDFFGTKIAYPILGMPRNDGLFDDERMKSEKWIDTGGRFVVTYMPTHRAYGRGAVSPTPFAHRPDIQKWMEENGVLLVMKNHPNMIGKARPVDTPTSIDITASGIDPQVALYHTDVLITDYSSAWHDFLLLRRPIIFYYYDDFEEEDEGLLYSVHDQMPQYECFTEDELFQMIRTAKEDYDRMRPSAEWVSMYHLHLDGHSCQRHYEEIRKRYEDE